MKPTPRNNVTQALTIEARVARTQHLLLSQAGGRCRAESASDMRIMGIFGENLSNSEAGESGSSTL